MGGKQFLSRRSPKSNKKGDKDWPFWQPTEEVRSRQIWHSCCWHRKCIERNIRWSWGAVYLSRKIPDADMFSAHRLRMPPQTRPHWWLNLARGRSAHCSLFFDELWKKGKTTI